MDRRTFLTALSGFTLAPFAKAAKAASFVNSFWLITSNGTEGVLAKLATADTDPAGSDTVINLDSEVYDRTDWHSNTTNNSRLTVPAGVSLVRAIFGFDCASTPNVRSLKNGASHAGRGQRKQGAATRSRAFSGVLGVVPGDYFEFTSTTDVNVEDRSWCAVEALDPATKYALVRRTTNLTLTASTNTVVGFDAETADIGGWHDNSTNNSRLTVPSGVTRIRVSGGADFSSDASGTDTSLFIHKNGASLPGRPQCRYFSSSGVTYQGVMSAILEVVAGDYFEMSVATQTTSRDLVAGDGTWFCIEEVIANPKRALVNRTANMTVVSGIETAVNFDAEVYDTDSIHDNVTNQDRLVVPSGVTQAKLTFGVILADASTIQVARVFKNGASFAGTAFDGNTANTASFSDVLNATTTWIDVVAGDYFQLMVTTGVGSTAVVAGDSTWFAMECR